MIELRGTGALLLAARRVISPCVYPVTQELCRAAVMLPVRELMPYSTSLSTMKVDGITMDQSRPVTMEDFEAVFDRVRPTGECQDRHLDRQK